MLMIKYVLFRHLAGPGESVTGLSNTDVQTEFPDLQIPHGVLGFVPSHIGSESNTIFSLHTTVVFFIHTIQSEISY